MPEFIERVLQQIGFTRQTDDADERRDTELNTLRAKVVRLSKKNAALIKRLRVLERQVKETAAPAEISAPETAAPPSDAEEKRLELALSLVKFRDQLLYFRDDFENDGEKRGAKMLSNLYRETGRFMNENGIEPIELDGVFDPKCQKVYEVEYTDDSSADNTVARTFRAGYRIDGRLHRPQEVFLKVLKTEV